MALHQAFLLIAVVLLVIEFFLHVVPRPAWATGFGWLGLAFLAAAGLV
jgi:hypothetical protein